MKLKIRKILVNILALVFLITLIPVQVINAAPQTKPKARSVISGTKEKRIKENVLIEKIQNIVSLNRVAQKIKLSRDHRTSTRRLT